MLTRRSQRLGLFPYWQYLSLVLFTSYININTASVNAQTIDVAQVPNANTPNSPVPPNLRPQDVIPAPSPPSVPQIPRQPPNSQEDVLPSLPSPSQIPEVNVENCPAKITVTEFEFEIKHPVFPLAKLIDATNGLLNKPLSCAELLQAALIITNIYQEGGYQTSGAKVVIPSQTLQEGKGKGIVKIEVIEGELEEIKVIPFSPQPQTQDSGSSRPTNPANPANPKPLILNPEYVRSRLALATSTPLNVPRLEEALQLLRLNAPIDKISATLSAGSAPGKSVLQVEVKDANTFNTPLSINNSRSPSAGTFQRRVGLSEGNLLGLGDSLSWNYNNTDGSDGWDMSYTLPLNPRNGTLNFSYSNTSSNVIEPSFKQLDIKSNSRTYELTLRQPIIQRIKQQTFQEFAVGITASRRESESSLLGIPYPLSPGADDQGRTRISALRFFQEWTQQNSQGVIAVRSQFNFGIGAFGATINQPLSEVNEVIPDSRFFSWQGQAQWVRLLAPETLLLLRSNVQLADRSLLPAEQFAIGGLGSVRGYRQDTLLTDNGIFTSAEVQLPILRIPKWQSLLQLTPFVDYGTAWNSSGKDNPNPSNLASVGLGLQLRQGQNFTARLDWGIPLISIDSRERTWQENGLYFTLLWNPF